MVSPHRVQTYPASFPRNLDLMPLLSFQQAIDGDLQVSRIISTASVSLGSSVRDEFRSRDHDIIFRRNLTNRQKTDIIFDSGTPHKTISQRKFWEEMLDELAATLPEAVITERTTREPIPKELEETKELQGLNWVCQYQVSRGNRTNELRRRFNLHQLSNPYRLIQADCRQRKVWKREYCQRLRSVMKTESILGVDGSRGWTELFKFPFKEDKKFAFPPLSSKLNNLLIQNKWWQDTGVPRNLLGQVDSQTVEAIVYLLLNRYKIIAI